MITKTISYEDFNGNMVSKNFNFHLTKMDLLNLETSYAGGLEKKISEMQKREDPHEMVEFVKKIILMAYGERSADGERFVKKASDGHNLSDDFEQTDAFSELFFEIVQNPEEMESFLFNVLPKNLMVKVRDAMDSGAAPALKSAT